MRHWVLLLAVVSACAGSESAKEGAQPPTAVTAQSAAPAPAPATKLAAADLAAQPATPAVAVAPATPTASGGYDFTAMARALLVVGACGDGDLPEGFSAQVVAKHCDAIKSTQAQYKTSWVDRARPFFASNVPANIPKKVVYPFAGGDLSTALTVYPDADEITTMSLEPAGDPRTLATMTAMPTGKAKQPKVSNALVKALGTVQYELRFLYRVNFSNTANMIEAMRGGELPTQLIFGLSALEVHGYEIDSVRYFNLADDGSIQYLTDADVSGAPDPKTRAAKRNRLFANAEIRFKKPGGRVQIYRHIQVNLDNDHLEKDPRVLRHLEAKGPVAGMTKAASYLLSFDAFSTMRGYLMKNVVWMVSDATGVAPKWGKPAGFEYETWGGYERPHMNAGKSIAKNWRDEFAAQPKRKLGFRFGYYDGRGVNHLIIMRKKS